MRVTMVALILVSCLAGSGSAQNLMGGFNVDATPSAAGWYSGPLQARGWYFTPTSDFFLNGVETHFGWGSRDFDRDVTVEVLTDTRSAGGVLLRSGVFNSAIARSGYGGAIFDDLLLTGGSTYFIGLRNVAFLGGNVTYAPGSEVARGRLDMNNSGEYGSVAFNDPAILRLMGHSTVTPEPMSMVLLGTGLAGLAAVRLRRRRAPGAI